MPDIEFLLYVDEYSTGSAYSLEPADFEMFPKVSTYRESFCQLGLWSLFDTFPSQADLPQANSFAIGQNFIRKYNMAII